MYALFKDGVQISKVFPSIMEAWQLAINKNYILVVMKSYSGMDKLLLQADYEIREVKESKDVD